MKGSIRKKEKRREKKKKKNNKGKKRGRHSERIKKKGAKPNTQRNRKGQKLNQDDKDEKMRIEGNSRSKVSSSFLNSTLLVCTEIVCERSSCWVRLTPSCRRHHTCRGYDICSPTCSVRLMCMVTSSTAEIVCGHGTSSRNTKASRARSCGLRVIPPSTNIGVGT